MFWKEASRSFKKAASKSKTTVKKTVATLRDRLGSIKFDKNVRKRVILWMVYFIAATAISAVFWFKFLGINAFNFSWNQPKSGPILTDTNSNQGGEGPDEDVYFLEDTLLEDQIAKSKELKADDRLPVSKEDEKEVDRSGSRPQVDNPSQTKDDSSEPASKEELTDEASEKDADLQESPQEETETSFRLEDMIMPVDGVVIKGYGHQRSNTLNEWRFHPGIDIIGVEDKSVKAVLPGMVAEVRQDPQYGIVVVIDHGAGMSTFYGSLSVAHVARGERVSQGRVVGLVGDTAAYEMSEPEHLHFEVRLRGRTVDPLEYLNYNLK